VLSINIEKEIILLTRIINWLESISPVQCSLCPGCYQNIYHPFTQKGNP
jgi:hypothetical protein